MPDTVDALILDLLESEGRGQKSVVGGQRSVVGGRRSEVGLGPRSDEPQNRPKARKGREASPVSFAASRLTDLIIDLVFRGFTPAAILRGRFAAAAHCPRRA
jgi:hypothetical protein